MAWDSSMPTDFTDGNTVDEGDLDPIVTNILDLRDASRVVQGRVMNTAGPAAVTTTETNIPNLQLPGVPVESGKWYMVNLTLYVTMTGTGSSFFFRVRKSTALTGSVIVSAPFICASTGLDDTKTLVLPWQASATETASFHMSVQRLAGTGQISVYGGKLTAHWIEKMGDSAGVWAVT